MPGTPYNPQKYSKQKIIIDNLLNLWNSLHTTHDLNNLPMTLSDEEIWDSYDSFHDAEAEDYIFPEVKNRYDAMVLDDMRYKMEELQKQLDEIENLPIDESLEESIVTEEDVNALKSKLE